MRRGANSYRHTGGHFESGTPLHSWPTRQRPRRESRATHRLQRGHGSIPIGESLITRVTQVTIVTLVTCRRQSDVLPLERCDMSPRRRIASLTVASAVAIGLVVAVGVASPATADPCEGAAANAQPSPEQAFRLPNPGTHAFGPIGHKPVGANGSAPLPKLGLLPLAIINAIAPRSAQVQQQAAVIPPPNPRGNQQPPNPAQAVPNAAAAQPVPNAAAAQPQPNPGPDLNGPAPTSIVGWVTGPDSPNQTIQRFAISGTDLGIMWDDGGGQVLMAFGDTSGFCMIPGHQWRYNTLMRSADRSLSNTVSVAAHR